LDLEESERLKQFEQRLERRLAGGARRRYQQNRRNQWIRVVLYALWYALLACATASTIYHLAP
jgi:hypothetical protein